MRIAIDLTSLYGRRRTGVEMYSIDLYRALCTTNNEVVPIFHQKNEIDNNPRTVIIPKCNRIVLETFKLARVIRKISPDIVLFPVFPPALSCYKTGAKIIPTLHDLAFMDFKHTLNWKARLYLTPRFKQSLKKAYGIITISETIKHRLKNNTHLPVWNCGENISDEYKNIKNVNNYYLEKWALSPYNYIISVSTIEPRKNMRYLLEIVNKTIVNSNLKIVLVGRRGWGDDEQLKKLIDNLGDKLIFTEYVSMQELIALYHFAYSFVLLSVDEGFGRTPFEAVACGCKKIILSDIPIFRETFDGNATFLPLDDIDVAIKKFTLNNLKLVGDSFQLPFDILENRIDKLIHMIENHHETLHAGIKCKSSCNF